MKNKKYLKYIKSGIVILTLVIIVIACCWYIPFIKDLNTDVGRIAFKTKIDSLGFAGVLVIALLQIFQIFVAFLPGEPLEILAGLCYGKIGGTLLTFISCAIATSIIYCLSKKVGKKIIYFFVSKEKVDKVLSKKIFQGDNIYEILLIVFLIPGIPKDIFVYLVGILELKFVPFLLISTFARFPSIITSTWLGEEILTGNYMKSAGILGITMIISIIGIIVYNKLNKREK